MEWIITAKPSGKKGYKIFEAVDELEYIDWHKSQVSRNIAEGDTVYIYVGIPYMKIMLKMQCIKSTVPTNEVIDDIKYYNDPTQWTPPSEYFRLKKIEKIDDDRLSLQSLNALGLIRGNIQGTCKSQTHPKLFEYINDCFNSSISISNEYENIISNLNNIDSKYKESVSKLRIGQGQFREGLILKHGCKCMICNISFKELLIASHIKEFSKSNKSESIDLNNGLLLCANHDKLFDRHLISFDNKGKIIISDKVDKLKYNELNINENICINTNEKLDKYMSYHRKLIK